MEKLESKIKGYLNAASVITIMMIVLGAIFVLMPQTSVIVIRWIVTLVLSTSGVYMLVLYRSVGGLIMLILGTLIAAHPGVMDIFPVLLGVYMIISNFVKLSGASSLRSSNAAAFGASVIMNIIGLVCGVIILIHPSAFNTAFIVIIGITMIIYGVSDLVDMFILRQHLSTFSKRFNFHRKTKRQDKEKFIPISDIPEAKVVKKHKK